MTALIVFRIRAVAASVSGLLACSPHVSNPGRDSASIGSDPGSSTVGATASDGGSAEEGTSTADPASTGSSGLASEGGSTGGSGSTGGEDPPPEQPAASCSAQDVQDALDAAPAGAVVTIPAGTCDWEDAVVDSARSVWLRGAGEELTTIRRTADVTDFMLRMACSDASVRVRVSDLTFEGLADTSAGDNGLMLGSESEPCIDFRVHDVTMTGFGESALDVEGDARGVIYESSFLENLNPGLGYGVVVYGADGWPELTLGGSEAVFIEDSYFHGNRHNVAANHGARYVLRHSVVRTSAFTQDWGMVDAHGKKESQHGTRSVEVYDNSIQADDDVPSADGIYWRGGDGVVFDNVIDPAIVYTLKLRTELDCTEGYPVQDQTRYAWIWDNTFSGGATVDAWGNPPNHVALYPGCDGYFTEDVDYFLGQPPGYEPYVYPHPLREADW